jgi:hypothetical protein
MAQVTTTLADLKNLTGGSSSTATAVVSEQAAPQPKIDAQGRAYATGKRKNAVARVWIKPGSGKVTVNGRDIGVYFARPVLRMLPRGPLFRQIMGNLRVYGGAEHPHTAQQPETLDVGALNSKNVRA